MDGMFYPVGIIDETVPGGVQMSIMPPGDREPVQPGDPVVIYNQMGPHGAMARFRGTISEMGDSLASVVVDESDVNDEWPENVNPLGSGNPVYLGHQKGSWLPHPARQVQCPEERALMIALAREHQNDTGIEPTAGVIMAVDAPREYDNPE